MDSMEGLKSFSESPLYEGVHIRSLRKTLHNPSPLHFVSFGTGNEAHGRSPLDQGCEGSL